MTGLKVFPRAGFDPETHRELEVKVGALGSGCASDVCDGDHVFAKSWDANLYHGLMICSRSLNNTVSFNVVLF